LWQNGLPLQTEKTDRKITQKQENFNYYRNKMFRRGQGENKNRVARNCVFFGNLNFNLNQFQMAKKCAKQA
jgi:hypothetical protein